MSLTILGVDPGSRTTGFGVIQIKDGKIIHINHGVILLDPDLAFPLRMKELALAFEEVMNKYKPQDVVIEKIFMGKSADSAFKLGHARGVIMAEAGRGGAKVFEYATRAVKKGVSGNGGAAKEEVLAIMKNLLKINEIKRIDASDALAMAVHHGYELRKKSIFERAVSI